MKTAVYFLAVLLIFQASLAKGLWWEKTGQPAGIQFSQLKHYPDIYSRGGPYVAAGKMGQWFVLLDSAVYETVDFGNSWNLKGAASMMGGIAADATGRLFVENGGTVSLSPNGHLFRGHTSADYIDRSVDKGTTWQTVKRLNAYSPLYAMAFQDKFSYLKMWAGIHEGFGQRLLFYSMDSGSHWISYDTKYFQSEGLYSLAAMEGNVFVGFGDARSGVDTVGGIVRLWYGESIRDSLNFPKVGVTAIIIDRDHYIYAGTRGKGIYASMDGRGTFWMDQNAGAGVGLSNRQVFSLALDSAGILVAVTDQGIYKANTFNFSGIEQQGNLDFGSSALSAIPNPFNAVTQVWISGLKPGSMPTMLSIYNATGQRVRLISAGAGMGTGGIVWDGRDAAGRRLSNGVYVVNALVGGKRVEKRLILTR